MSKIGFSGNPSNGASHTWRSRRRFNYSSSKGGWQAKGATPPTPTAPTLNASTDLQDMNDATGLAARMRGMAIMYNSYSDFPTEDIYTGTFAYARDTNELYVWTGASPIPISWAGALGQVAGGWDSAARSSVDSINIATDTSVTSHASLTSQAAHGDHALSTGSYAVIPAGGTSMHKWSIPTGGDSSSFGDSLTNNDAQRGSAAGNGVRGVWRGNNSTRYNKFEWMALDTGGNTQHFADLPTKFVTDDAMAGNDTKGLSGMGSHQDDYGGTERCYYVIYDTTGSAYNFGNLGRDATRPCAAGDDTHGLWAGGGHANYSTVYSGITAVTYDTGGTAINGGSLSRARTGGCAMSDKTYVIFMGGYANGNVSTGARNDIDKRVIATGGNATLIGNLSTKRVFSSGTSGNAS